MKVLARINTTDTQDRLMPRTGLYTQLRKTPFTSSAVTGTEISTGVYEFDVAGTNLTAYLKCYVSTDNSTFEEYESWGGTDGIRQITEADVNEFVSKSAESQNIESTGGELNIILGAETVDFVEDEGIVLMNVSSALNISVPDFSISSQVMSLAVQQGINIASDSDDITFRVGVGRDYNFDKIPTSAGGSTPVNVSGYIEIVINNGQRIKIPYITIP